MTTLKSIKSRSVEVERRERLQGGRVENHESRIGLAEKALECSHVAGFATSRQLLTSGRGSSDNLDILLELNALSRLGAHYTRASAALSVENADQDTTKSRTSGKLGTFQLFESSTLCSKETLELVYGTPQALYALIRAQSLLESLSIAFDPHCWPADLSPLWLHSLQWILSELRYLHQLFVKTVRHLLHLLSTSASKVRAHVLELLRKYYSLLFATAPAKVHKTMVDFNRWLLEVLADTRSEGIEWGPSYGENPWLALEEREPQPEDPEIEEAFTLDAANTIQLLRASREHYMMCCDSLRQTNKDLTMQLEHLNMQLKGALSLAFESQRSLQREKELAALREQRPVLKVRFADYLYIAQQDPRCGHPSQEIANAFRTLEGLSSLSFEAAPADDPAPANDVDEDASEADAEADDGGSEPEDTEMTASTPVDQAEPVAKPMSEDEHESSEQQATPLLKPLSSISSGRDYQQLVQLNTSKEENGSWYRQALGRLKTERDQRRRLRMPSKKTTEAPVTTSSMMRKVEVEAASLKLYKPLAFKELAATRDPTHDASGSTWYRKALQLLKAERKHRVSLRDRAESFSSTISIVD